MSSPAETLAKSLARKTRKHKPTKQKLRLVWDCKVRSIRESFNLTIDDVVEKIGLSKTGYWAIEQGSDPMLSTAIRIAKFYGRDITELWNSFKGD